jgi:methionyl aminopeptidase
VVRELVGHGVGRKLHEDPEIPNFGKSGSGPILKEGLVIAIEPMINLGRRESRIASDKWTFVTVDGKPSAHYEHTLVVRKNNAEILSNHAIIHDEEKNNSNLINIS